MFLEDLLQANFFDLDTSYEVFLMVDDDVCNADFIGTVSGRYLYFFRGFCAFIGESAFDTDLAIYLKEGVV